MRPRVVFSDIDGTLVDTFTREYGRSKGLVKRLKESSIPVVLCSSKTWAEQEAIRKDLGLEEEPFIVENGGAVVFPTGYFDGEDGSRYVNGYAVIELGRPSEEIRRKLQEVRRRTGIAFRGVSDVSVEKLAEIVGMTIQEADRMSKRQYGETILEIDKSKMEQFERALHQEGLQKIHGGRYFDVTAGTDKGRAVRILMDLYLKKLGHDTTFIGIGDSPNDLPMLKTTDVAILVQMHNGSWADIGISDVVQVSGIGPAGFENAFAKIMEAEDR
jgi:mannosyl-3-phosphoglycerate phosphatase family protein